MFTTAALAKPNPALDTTLGAHLGAMNPAGEQIRPETRALVCRAFGLPEDTEDETLITALVRLDALLAQNAQKANAAPTAASGASDPKLETDLLAQALRLPADATTEDINDRLRQLIAGSQDTGSVKAMSARVPFDPIEDEVRRALGLDEPTWRRQGIADRIRTLSALPPTSAFDRHLMRTLSISPAQWAKAGGEESADSEVRRRLGISPEIWKKHSA